jgi:hypothetical protein
MLEYLAPGFVYSLIKDGWAGFRGRKRHLRPSSVVASRKKWKEEIDAKLWERRQKDLSMDVVVRDVKRINEYPDAEGKKGMPPPRTALWIDDLTESLCS